MYQPYPSGAQMPEPQRPEPPPPMLMAVRLMYVGAGLSAIGLWILMARANGAGKSWARIVASVLFAINTLDLLASAVQVHAPVSLAFAGLVWLAGLGATILLWRRESSQ